VIIGSVLVGLYQILQGVILGIGAAGTIAFGMLTEAVGYAIEALGQIIPGLSEIGRGIVKFGRDTQSFGDALGQEAENSFGRAIANFENPLQDFDARMAQAQQEAANAAKPPVELAGRVAGESMAAAIRASSKDLKAIVVGTSEGESFRNSLMRGADPRFDVKEESRRTADATERTAAAVEELAAAGGGGGIAGLSIASIMV
jgi:hypothetical protein